MTDVTLEFSAVIGGDVLDSWSDDRRGPGNQEPTRAHEVAGDKTDPRSPPVGDRTVWGGDAGLVSGSRPLAGLALTSEGRDLIRDRSVPVPDMSLPDVVPTLALELDIGSISTLISNKCRLGDQGQPKVST